MSSPREAMGRLANGVIRSVRRPVAGRIGSVPQTYPEQDRVLDSRLSVAIAEIVAPAGCSAFKKEIPAVV